MEFLAAKRQIAACVIEGQTYYKIAAGEELVTFEETDTGILKLHQTLGHLNGEICALEGEVKELEAKVRQCVKSGCRPMAKTQLRRQKMAEASLEKKLGQVVNLESVLEGIVGAETSGSVVECYRAGLAALRNSLAQHSSEVRGGDLVSRHVRQFREVVVNVVVVVVLVVVVTGVIAQVVDSREVVT